MLRYITSIILSESKKLEEIFSTQNRRAYQRDFDRLKQQMIANGLNPDDYVKNDAKITTAEMQKIQKALHNVEKSKEQQAKHSSELSSIQDQIDTLYDELDIAGKTELADNLASQSLGKDDPNKWLLDQYKRILNPEQEWYKTGKEFDQEMPIDMPDADMAGHGIADADVNQLPDESEDEQSSNIRRFSHLITKISDSLEISKTEMASFLSHIGVDENTIDAVFPVLNKKRISSIAAGRAIKRIKNANPNILSALKDSVNNIMKYGTYRESVKLSENIAVLSEHGMSIIPKGSTVFLIK